MSKKLTENKTRFYIFPSINDKSNKETVEQQERIA